MNKYILEEMDKLSADGVEFISIMTDYSKPYNPILVMTRDELITAKAFPKTGRRYFKLVDGNKVYLD